MLICWFWREIIFGVTYVLSVQYTCAIVSVFWLWREIVLWQEIVLKMRTPFDFLWAVSTKKSYLVFGCTVSKKDSYSVSLIERESASKCVYFVRSNTLLLCISLLCIYLLYGTDPQTHRIDHFLKFPELSGQVGISRIPSKNADRKLPIFLVNTLFLIQFHKHSFTPYPSLSGQVGISSILQRTLIENYQSFW